MGKVDGDSRLQIGDNTLQGKVDSSLTGVVFMEGFKKAGSVFVFVTSGDGEW